jgi:hypothetical protein
VTAGRQPLIDRGNSLQISLSLRACRSMASAFHLGPSCHYSSSGANRCFVATLQTLPGGRGFLAADDKLIPTGLLVRVLHSSGISEPGPSDSITTWQWAPTARASGSGKALESYSDGTTRGGPVRLTSSSSENEPADRHLSPMADSSRLALCWCQ